MLQDPVFMFRDLQEIFLFSYNNSFTQTTQNTVYLTYKIPVTSLWLAILSLETITATISH